jgi:hypothetical protein
MIALKPYTFKKYLSRILILTLFYACTKSGDPVKPPLVILPTASTYYYANNHLISYRNFSFDSSQHLVSVYLRQNDTIDVSTGLFLVDSGTYYFNLNPSTNLPDGYYSVYKKSYTGAQTNIETHLMYYNSQNQLIKDSGLLNLAGQNPNPPTSYFTYSGNTIICNSYLGGSPFLTDTLIMSNGNLIYFHKETFVYTPTYSTAANPFYTPELSNSLGAFLMIEGIGEFISKNLPDDNGFTWVTGNNGMISSGSSPNGDYVQFTY